MTLTQKETTLLQDLKTNEQLCVEKYTKYSNDACDSQLKNLFSEIRQTEQQHLDTISQILSGTVPQVSSTASSQQNTTTISANSSLQSNSQWNSQSNMQSGSQSGSQSSSQTDKYLCEDALSTEKHVSSTYNTCVFEFADTNIRNILNHIQKEEQQHGEKIYNYMAQKGLYN